MELIQTQTRIIEIQQIIDLQQYRMNMSVDKLSTLFIIAKTMKKYRLLFLLAAAVVAGLSLTSCTPEEVDAFADGYRKGYYGTWSESQTPEMQIDEEPLQ